MKNYIMFVTLSLLIIGKLICQPAEEWERVYHSVNSNDAGKKVAVDGQGNVYVASNINQFGIVNKTKCFVSKYNQNGAIQITMKPNFDSASSDYLTDMVMDQSGYCYITGYTVKPGGNSDYFTCKISFTTGVVWFSIYGGSSGAWDIARAIAVDGNGNVYVTGSGYNGSLYSDFTTVKYNSSGAQQWVAAYDGPGRTYDDALDIAVDAAGSVIITGSSYGGASTEYDIATVKYNTSGIQQWVQRYNGPAFSDFAKTLTTDISGNIFVTGYSTGIGTGYDYITIKYNTNGSQLWAQRYNGPGTLNDYPYDIKVSSKGDVYVTGSSAGLKNETGFATVKYNSSGVQQWAQRYMGLAGSTNYPNSMSLDSKDNIIVTGPFYSSQSGYDYKILSYSSAGVLTWSAAYNGNSNSSDYSYSSATDLSGNVIITGLATNNNTGQDITTIKYNNSGVQQWVAVFDGALYFNDLFLTLECDPQGNIYETVYNSYPLNSYNILKYNSSGTLQWSQQYPATDSISFAPYAAYSVVDKYGNYYVTGSYRKQNNNCALTIKYNTYGVRQWAAIFGDSFSSGTNSEPYGIALDSSGNVLVTGSSNSDIMTLKYSSSGVLQWSDIYNVGGSTLTWDKAYAIAADPSGNIYVTGGNSGYVTIKYHPSGSKIWVKTYSLPNQSYNHATDIAIDISGNIIVTGGDLSDIINTNYEYITIKYSSTGSQLWAARHAGSAMSSFDRIKIKTDNAGNIYTAGTYYSNYQADYQLIKYSPSGTEQWEAAYNSPANDEDYCSDIALDASGNVFLTGKTRNFNFRYDITVLKFNSSGVLQWTVVNNRPMLGATFDFPASALDSYGNLYIAGTEIITYSGYGIVTAKYSQGSNKPVLSKNNMNNTENNLPQKFELYNNYPNPFNPETKINFDLPMNSIVNIIIYDITGKEVIKLMNNENKEAGSYTVSFNGSNLSSGIYFYKITVSDPADKSVEYFSKTLKMVLVK